MCILLFVSVCHIVCEIVNQNLKATVEAIFQREVEHMVKQLKESLEARIQALQSTLSDIAGNLELQTSGFQEKIDQLDHRAECLERENNRLRTEANLVLSGLPD